MTAPSITAEQLLIEVEDLLRTVPSKATRRQDTEDNHTWLGRAANVVERWNTAKGSRFSELLVHFQDFNAGEAAKAFQQMMFLLRQAQSDLRMTTSGPTSIAITQGSVWNYFDEIRKTIELATEEVFFVDPYLDADFVSRYLPHVQSGVAVRLLTSDKKLGTLLPAVDLFVQQCACSVKVRSTNALHDRFLFIDKTSCYLSGASFKDGARNAGAIITQITDAFKAMWEAYDTVWMSVKKERE
jgi:hypothetical protein